MLTLNEAYFKKVAITYNDDLDIMQGPKHEVVSWQGVVDTAEKVADALRTAGIETALVPLKGDIGGFIKNIQAEEADIVFNLCEGALGKSAFEMNAAALMELLGLRFTGSGPVTLGLALDKGMSKAMLMANDIPTAPYLVMRETPSRLSIDLRFPLIVKPVHEDASLGIDEAAVVRNMAALKKRVNYVLQEYRQPALVEEYIDGNEFNVSVIGNNKPRVLPVSEIDFSQLSNEHPRICTYDAKWIPDSPYYLKTPPRCPAVISEELEQELVGIALRAYNALRCRDYARIDMRMGEDGLPKVLEVNPNPDISPEAGFARSAIVGGMSYPQLIFKIVTIALERYLGKHS